MANTSDPRVIIIKWLLIELRLVDETEIRVVELNHVIYKKLLS